MCQLKIFIIHIYIFQSLQLFKMAFPVHLNRMKQSKEIDHVSYYCFYIFTQASANLYATHVLDYMQYFCISMHAYDILFNVNQ